MTARESKLPNIGNTIFSEMSSLAKAHHALNLGQGFPDYQPDQALMQAVFDAMVAGHNQYAPMPGVLDLRIAIENKVLAQHGVNYEPETEITVTAGATEALMSSFQALVNNEDEVILIDPSYDLYAPAVVLAGGMPIRVDMLAPNATRRQFAVDWDAIESAFSDKTRMLVLNFPHNPTGVVLHEMDLDALEHLIAKHPQCIIVSDEAYEHIVFDGEAQRSVVRRPLLAACTVLISSFGKSLHATGWKIGYCCAPKALMQEIRKVHQFSVFSVNTPMQVAITHYLHTSMQALTALAGFYQKKRDRLTRGLLSTKLKPLHSAGTFFLLVDTSAVAARNEKELAVRLTKEIGVTSVPVSAFYPEPKAPSANHALLRLCFAKQDSTLDQAVERLQRL